MSTRRDIAPVGDCYTCSLLPEPIEGPHKHSFDDLRSAEKVERRSSPRRSKALWDMVNRAKEASSNWLAADRVVCSDVGREASCAEPIDLYCYGAYQDGCGAKVSYRPGAGPSSREIFCPEHGRQPWPPEFRRACASTELDR